MAKPALVIDMLAGPGDEDDDASDDGGEEAPLRSKQDPDQLIASIKSQLDRLASLTRQLG